MMNGVILVIISVVSAASQHLNERYQQPTFTSHENNGHPHFQTHTKRSPAPLPSRTYLASQTMNRTARNNIPSGEMSWGNRLNDMRPTKPSMPDGRNRWKNPHNKSPTNYSVHGWDSKKLNTVNLLRPKNTTKPTYTLQNGLGWSQTTIGDYGWTFSTDKSLLNPPTGLEWTSNVESSTNVNIKPPQAGSYTPPNENSLNKKNSQNSLGNIWNQNTQNERPSDEQILEWVSNITGEKPSQLQIVNSNYYGTDNIKDQSPKPISKAKHQNVPKELTSSKQYYNTNGKENGWKMHTPTTNSIQPWNVNHNDVQTMLGGWTFGEYTSEGTEPYVPHFLPSQITDIQTFLKQTSSPQLYKDVKQQVVSGNNVDDNIKVFLQGQTERKGLTQGLSQNTGLQQHFIPSTSMSVHTSRVLPISDQNSNILTENTTNIGSLPIEVADNPNPIVLSQAITAQALSTETFIPIVNMINEFNEDGTYKYAYETGNGIQVEETGLFKNNGSALIKDVSGSYSYLAPDGIRHSVSYTANDKGFQPQGAHLPISPPVTNRITERKQRAAQVVVRSIGREANHLSNTQNYFRGRHYV